jgi:DNA-binding transcriptional LysR family regulator
MDLRRLRAFVCVAEQGTVSKAAELLHITQPALSRTIGALEDELGFKLFERAGRRLTLTAYGEQLLSDCRSIVTSVTTLRERAQALRGGEIKVLRVAASALTIEAVFPQFLHRYARSEPGVKLSLVEADAAEHLNMLERGEVHLAVNVVNVVQVDDHRFGTFLLPQFQVLAACARTFPIESGDAIDIRKLVQQPLLLLDESFATRNIFDAACRVAGVRAEVFVESGAAHALLALAQAGHGIAIIPSILPLDQHKLRSMRVTHRREPLRISLAVLWDKRRALPRYAEGFADALAGYIRDVFPLTPRPAQRPQPPAPRGGKDSPIRDSEQSVGPAVSSRIPKAPSPRAHQRRRRGFAAARDRIPATDQS